MKLTLYQLSNLTSLSPQHVHSHVASSMILLMHSWNLLMHMHAIGAAEGITLVELEADPQEESQEMLFTPKFGKKNAGTRSFQDCVN